VYDEFPWRQAADLPSHARRPQGIAGLADYDHAQFI
jgi:hypothetical protein